MSINYENLQPWVDMLCDALENRGASSSGIPDLKVYPYAEKYRQVLNQIRTKTISKYQLEFFLRTSEEEILSCTTQEYRVKNILRSLREYFLQEFMRK